MPGDEAEPEPMLTADEVIAEYGPPVEEPESIVSNEDWVYRKADQMQRKMPGRTGRADRRTEGEVFDRSTLMTLHRLLTHGLLKSLDFPVATGKEANVFRGTTPQGGYVAVKIFRINTATFKHVLEYVQGDERFAGVTGDKRQLVHTWCQKEFRNLVRMHEADVSVPEPLKAVANVLVMEYLGKKEGPWPRLKELPDLGDPERLYRELVDDYVKAFNGAELVHADLSEYNIMVEGADGPPETFKPRIIDVGQAVLMTHPNAGQFLQRDLKNLTGFFRKKGVDAKPEDITSRLKRERGEAKEAFVRPGFEDEDDETEEDG
jgi:RIO kinase 1